MIYTCYDMIRDCRAGKAEGWSYFIATYVPVLRRLLAHYRGEKPDNDRVLERILIAVRRPECTLFQSMEPAPERWFTAQLRQEAMAELPGETPEIDLDLETVATALTPLTLVEKQAVWLEGMRYSAPQTGVLLRMAPTTVEKIRATAADLIRGKVDTWNRTLLADNGRSLGQAATGAKGEDCLPAKPFLDMLDGRTTWRGRQEVEQHVTKCWHCIDHFCRLVEVVELVRGIRPLSEEEAEPFRKRLGVEVKKAGAWKKMFGKA